MHAYECALSAYSNTERTSARTEPANGGDARGGRYREGQLSVFCAHDQGEDSGQVQRENEGKGRENADTDG